MKVPPLALLSLCSSGVASAFVTLGGANKHTKPHHSSEFYGSPDFNDFLDNPYPGRNQGRKPPTQQKPQQPRQIVPDTQSARQKPQSTPPSQPTSPWIARRIGGRPLQVDNTVPAEQTPKRIDPHQFKSFSETRDTSSAEEPAAKSEPDKVPNETDPSTLEQSRQPDTTATKPPPPPPPPATSWRPPVVIGGVDSSRSNVLQTQRRNTPNVRYYKGMNPQVPPPTIKRPNTVGGPQGKPAQVPPPKKTPPKPPGPKTWKPTLIQKPKPTASTPTTADAANKAAEPQVPPSSKTPPKPRPEPKAWKSKLVQKPKPTASTPTADAANKAAETRRAVMAKRQEAAIARKAAERETALQLQQRVARLREQRRIEYERKRQERLERAASQEENRRLEQNRKQQERIAREEERRARAIQDEEKRKEAAAYAAAKLAEASKPETQSKIATKEIPDETAKSSAEPDTASAESAEPDEKTRPTRPDARLPRAYVGGSQHVPSKASAKLDEASKTETQSEPVTKDISDEPAKSSFESKPSTDSAKPKEKTSPTRPDVRLPRAYVGGRQQVPPKAAVQLARAVKPVGRPLGTTEPAPPPNQPSPPGASTAQGGPEGTSMKPDSKLPIGNVDEQRAIVAARLARSVQPVRPVGYSSRAIPKTSPYDSASVKSGPKRPFMRPDARLPIANVDERQEKAAEIAARLAKTVQPVRSSDATRDSGKAATSKPVADTTKIDTDEKSTKPDSRFPTRNVRNMDSALPNYFSQMNQAGTKSAADAKEPIAWVFPETQPPPTLDRMPHPKVEPSVETPLDAQVKDDSSPPTAEVDMKADAKEPIAWVFEETQPPPTLDRMSRPKVETAVETPPVSQVKDDVPPTAAAEVDTKAAQEEATRMEQETLREAQEALRAAEEEARKLAYERKRIEEQVKLVQEANARRMLEIETRAKRESFRKQRALLAARLEMEKKSGISKTSTSLEMTSSAVQEQSGTVDDAAALEDPIPPQFRVLSAKYMARLEKAAKSNPKSLKEEFEKMRIAKDGENDDGESPYV